MKTRLLRRITAKILRGLGYTSVLLQWLWVAVVALPPLIERGAFSGLSPTRSADTPVQQFSIEPSPLVWILVAVITIFIFTVTIITLLRIPKAILKGGDKIISETSEVVLPVLSHHKPLPAKKRQALKLQITLSLQLAVSLLALIASLFLLPVQQITKEIILTVSVWLAAFSVICSLTAWLVRPTLQTLSRESHE